MTKHSANNDCSSPGKLSKFNFNIIDNAFEGVQTGYQPKTTISFTDWSVKVIGATIQEPI